MPVYTVHEPPPRTAAARSDPERFVFVRDGFYVWAFLLAPLWMLWHRLWLVLLSYVAISLVVDAALVMLGASFTIVVVAGIVIAVLVGLEASTLFRFTLRRRGWKNVGIVSGDDQEDAERRFFDAWMRDASSRPKPPSAAVPPRPPLAAPAGASGVIGLFPEPGAQR
jgi:hypothetical protein